MPTEWCNFVYDNPHYAERETLRAAPLLQHASRRISVVPQQPLPPKQCVLS